MTIKTIDLLKNTRNIKYINRVIDNLHNNLGLVEIELPMFIEKNSPLNDGLNGEKPVSFICTGNNKEYEIVHSHAKMKRFYLNKYKDSFSNRFENDLSKPNGIVTRMNAIRSFEDQDVTHHYNVRQLDICLIAPENDGNNNINDVIKTFVNGIITSLEIENINKIEFIESIMVPTADNLLDIENKREQFENKCGLKYGAFVILGIGKSNPCNVTKDGNIYAYDHRSPDYDDHRYNGDILIYHPKLQRSIEICSFGYRVNNKSLKYQMDYEDREINSNYHYDIINNNLVQTIGGGIGIDRLLMVKFNELSVHDTNPN